MNAMNATHPNPEDLAAFSLGRLDDAAAETIEEHLSECEACRQAVASAPVDSFVAKVRASESIGGATALLERNREPDAASTAATQTLGGGRVSTDVPAELMQHSRYQVLGLVGAGGMGAVFKAQHKLMQRTVALKVINPNLVARPGTIDRFRREVQAAGQLSHPNIVHSYDADQAGDAHFLVMEYVDGVSLSRLVAENGPLPVDRACSCIQQAAAGLQHAFERGMVHRDIKPQNLMLTPGGQVKILDFGLARFALESAPAGALLTPADAAACGVAGTRDTPSDSLTQVGTVMGTPDYIAPEQARDAHTADIRADIYSLGCTLYDLLAGRPPFPEGTALQKVIGHMESVPRSLTELRPDIPADLARVIDKMMAKDPAQRYQTPVEAADALAPFAAPSPVGPTPQRRGGGSAMDQQTFTFVVSARRQWALVLIIGVLLTLLIMAGSILGCWVLGFPLDSTFTMISAGVIALLWLMLLVQAWSHIARQRKLLRLHIGPDGVCRQEGAVRQLVPWGAITRVRVRTVRRVRKDPLGPRRREAWERAKQHPQLARFMRAVAWLMPGPPRPPEPFAVEVYTAEGQALTLTEFEQLSKIAELIEAGVDLGTPVDRENAPAPARSLPRWPGGAAVIAVCLLAAVFLLPLVRELAQTVIRIATNRGVLVIEAEDKDLEITIVQADNRVVVDEKVGQRTTRTFEITATDGEVDMQGMSEGGLGIKSKTPFQLTRGGKVVLTARMLMANAIQLDSSPKLVDRIELKQEPFTREGVSKAKDGWRIDARQPRTVRLFEVDAAGAGNCLLIYRAKVKATDLDGSAQMEIGCDLRDGARISDKGRNTSNLDLGPGGRGTLAEIAGAVADAADNPDWAVYEIGLRIEPGQAAGRVMLNLVVEGTGTVWIKDMSLRKTPLPVKGDTDLDRLQGRWIPTAGEMEGKPWSIQEVREFVKHLEFDRDKGFYSRGDGKTEEGVVKLDTTKNPRWLDVTRPEGPGRRFGIMSGIYELQGDTLRLCLGEPEDPRPKAFASQAGTRILYITLQRESLFNGKDLTGWEGDNAVWKWEEGRLVGRQPANSAKEDHLLWGPAEFKNFELSFDVRLKDNKGYGGVFFRGSLFLPTGLDKGSLIRGHRADIGSGRWGTVSLVDVDSSLAMQTSKTPAVVRIGDFNHYGIRCVGQHLTVRVNGSTTIDEDLPKLPSEGLFAWQLGGGAGTEITFANIRIRKLLDSPLEKK
jgi:uncharacterized protein (TIGR03067 family)